MNAVSQAIVPASEMEPAIRARGLTRRERQLRLVSSDECRMGPGAPLAVFVVG